MNLTEIQKRVNQLSSAMLAKGLRQPEVSVHVKSNEAPCVLLCWKDKSRAYDSAYTTFREGTLAASFAAADEHVTNLPTPEQARMNEFMACLGKAIDLGKDNGIDVEFLNPLTATMKRLSENALTFRSSAAEAR